MAINWPPDTRLRTTATTLLQAITAACLRSSTTAEHVRATRLAYQLTRLAVREAIASTWRDNLKAAAQLTPAQTAAVYRDGCWYDLTQRSNYTGD